MIKRLITFIKAPWICGIATKISLGLAGSIVAFEYIRKEFEGSEVGDKILPIVDDIQKFAEVALESINKIVGFVCGGTAVQAHSLSLDQALEAIRTSTVELKKDQ